MSKQLQYLLATVALGAILAVLAMDACNRRRRSLPATSFQRPPSTLPSRPSGLVPGGLTQHEKPTGPSHCTWAEHPCDSAFDFSSRCYAELKARRYETARKWCNVAARLDASSDVRAMIAYNSGLVDCHLGERVGAADHFRESLQLRPVGPGAKIVQQAMDSLEAGKCLE